MLQFNPTFIAYLSKLNNDENNKVQLRECDYSKLISLILPQFYHLTNNWCIAPEFALTGNYSPDYLVSLINIVPGIHYGFSNHRLVVETKNRVAVS